jgi:hypothetical protein
MKAKKTEVHVRAPRERKPVRIVSDAAVSTRGTHGGRMLLLLILDTSDRPDIEEFIRAHQSMGPGDVQTQWGQIDGHDRTIALFLTFIRPVELFMILEFDIATQGFMIDQILTAHGLYICVAERDDDRLAMNPDRPKVIVEVGGIGFDAEWDKLFHKHLAKYLRDTYTLSRADARRGARTVIADWRKFGHFRMPDVRDCTGPADRE